MKVLIISRHFLSDHPKAGQPTYFVDKIYTTLRSTGFLTLENVSLMQHYAERFGEHTFKQGEKFHTIRPTVRWKVGEMASLRFWTGAAYRSEQFEFARVRLKNVYDISIGRADNGGFGIKINGKKCSDMDVLANNDGLPIGDFQDWFPLGRKFDGQILSWSDKIQY